MRNARTGRISGFTIVELLVVVSIIALLIAILLPAIGKARDSALVTQSSGNLRNMGTACAGYGADWNDRQWTAGPDDAGLFQGQCSNYLQNAACPPQMILGWSSGGGMWGYWLGSEGNCNISVGNCGNWPVYKAIEFTGADRGFGYFRLPNAKSFAGYINNKFYDPVCYAPKDKINLAIAEKYFGQADQFNSIGGDIAFSTYCFSPAAIWSPDVFDKRGYKNPNTLAGGWRSPAVGMCTYPDLKTRMLEHSWLQNTEATTVNPNFAGGNEPYYFNHGYNSAPVTLFFDGHVATMSVADAMESDLRATNANQSQQGWVEKGLWHRQTPFGANGYFGPQAFDWLVMTSYHILTTDGIQGRDTAGAR
jgi:prepilin-type N-terminal cleavage/methylation domain-containing protein